MSKQKFFNKIWKHFVTNKGKRATHQGSCLYITPDGHACAAGILMNKKEREVAATYGGTIDLLKKYGNMPDKFLGHEDFVRDAQRIHDNQRFGRIKERPAMLRKLAVAYDLKVPT